MAQHNRRLITVFIYPPVHALLFGIGLLIVLLLIPRSSAHLGFWIATVVIVTFVLAVPIAWLVAPRLQARYDRKRQAALRTRPWSAPLIRRPANYRRWPTPPETLLRQFAHA
jgi:hypothetical protein